MLKLASNAQLFYAEVMAQSMSTQNPEIYDFLSKNKIAVLATSNKETNAPHASVIYYSVTSKLSIFFLTKEETQKNRDLNTNPQISLAIFNAETQTTVQLRGIASRVNDQNRLKDAIDLMTHNAQETAQTTSLPISRLKAGEYVLYKISPQNIRMAEYKLASEDQIFRNATPILESLE